MQYPRDRAGYIFAVVLSVCFASSLSAETLRELLDGSHVPTSKWTSLELAERVQGAVGKRGQETWVAYRILDGELSAGPLRAALYNSQNNAVRRQDKLLNEADVCVTSPEELKFVGEFALISTSISPSAGCILVVSKSLSLQQTLYGFAPVEVAPGTVALIESMRHFAPVHPERLQLGELQARTVTELYPPKDDLLRTRFIAENAKHLPDADTCMQENISCDAQQFDEDIEGLNSDRQGHFAFLAIQAATYRPESPTGDEGLSQTVLYIYAKSISGWLFCEQEVPANELDDVRKKLAAGFDQVASRCSPKQKVVPDMSTAGANPFLKP